LRRANPIAARQVPSSTRLTGSGTSFDKVPVNVAIPPLVPSVAVTVLALKSKEPPGNVNRVGFVKVIVTLPEFPCTDPMRLPVISLPPVPGGAENVTARSNKTPL